MSVDCINKQPETCVWDKILPKNESSCVMSECPEQEKTSSGTVKDALCPKPLTVFEHCSQVMAECRYHRSKYPVEKGPINPLSIPCCLDRVNTTFGTPSVLGESAKELISPSKSADQVALETLDGHDLYKITHKDYFPGELVTRKYCCPSYDPFMKFGEKTNCDYEGKKTKKLLQPDLNSEPLRFSSCRFNNFSDRYISELGKPLNILKGSSCLPLDFTHGKPSVHDKYSLGDLLHYRNENQILRGKRNLRAKIARVKTHLKKANSTNFDNAKQAFQFYDKKKAGVIDARSLREVLQQFNIFLTNKELSELIMDCKETCHNVNECVFPACVCCSHCMIGLNERKCINQGTKASCDSKNSENSPNMSRCSGCSQEASCTCQASDSGRKNPKKCSTEFCDRYVYECRNKCDECCCNKEAGIKIKKCDFEECCNPDCDCVTFGVINFNEFVNFLNYSFFTPVKKGDAEVTTRLVKQIDKRGTDYSRTSQEIDSAFGEVDLKKINTFGKISNLTKSLMEEYGISENVYKLHNKVDRVKPILHPSPFLHFGFTEEDLNKQRTKEQIQQIFCRDVARLSCCQFEEVFNLAIMHPTCCTTSVEKFKNVLDHWISCGCLNLLK